MTCFESKFVVLICVVHLLDEKPSLVDVFSHIAIVVRSTHLSDTGITILLLYCHHYLTEVGKERSGGLIKSYPSDAIAIVTRSLTSLVMSF